MKTKKVTLLLMLTVISLLTIFLVVLMDDSVLAASEIEGPLLQNLNLSEASPGTMMVDMQPNPEARFLRDDPLPLKAV